MPIKTLENIFSLASRENANRITISNSEKDYACHLDFPGDEGASFKLPKKLESDLVENLRRLLKLAPQELARGKYCKLHSKKYRLNFLLSILPDKHGEKIVISMIKNKASLYTLNKLGLQTQEKKTFKKNLAKKGGLIVIASKERQGRSTTLFSCLEQMDRDKKSVYFMGSYPEFDLNGLISLKNNVSSWDRVLKHDSDIIAIDDDSPDSLRQAIIAASTGRLVLTTIQAINSLEALYKLLKLGLPWNLVLDNLDMISGQSLANLKRSAKKNFRPGRRQIGLFEVLSPNKKLVEFLKNHQAQINTKKFWEKTLELAKKNNYRPLTLDASQKKKEGII
jgi:type II secretory ATPase GspE/PulE/Tfp pilus assembly ATPase PilB-like protein